MKGNKFRELGLERTSVSKEAEVFLYLVFIFRWNVSFVFFFIALCRCDNE